MMIDVDKSDLFNFPILSDAERHRRWEALRDLMRKNAVDAVLVLPHPSPFLPPDAWLTNDESGAYVVFPLEGEPTVVGPGSFRAGAWVQARDRGEASWIPDWRFHPGADTIVGVLKEKDLDGKRVGTIGAIKGSHLSPAGWVTYGLWSRILSSLPKTEFVELWDQFVVIWLTKSEEELRLFRHAARIAEAACVRMLDVARPGVTEAELYAETQYEILKYGARTDFMILHSGPDNPGWGVPKWRDRAQRPRAIQEGDIIVSELFPYVGQEQAQAQMCIAVGKVDEVNLRLARLARKSYEVGLDALRPGVRFADVALAMNRPLERENAWRLTPIVHSMNPLESVGAVTEGLEAVTGIKETFDDLYEHPITGGDMIIQPGMTFQLEPNACTARHRVNIGGNVIVTENGCEALNEIPCELRFV